MTQDHTLPTKALVAVPRKGPALSLAGLDMLMPLHIWIGPTGHILRVGPTLQKLRPDIEIVGRRASEFLEFRRPREVQHLDDLLAFEGQQISVLFRDPPRNSLRGLVVGLPRGQGALLNLSLGISVAEMVRDYGLNSKDFAPSDSTVEMLYLIEAQSVVLQEAKSLNSRLLGARVAAEERAFTDTLTGLKNRRALDHILNRLTNSRRRKRFGLMNVDLDYFKSVNDTYGHAAGDHVLQKAASIFVEETRAEDIVARTGGDEFVIVLMNCDDLTKLKTIADRIIERLEKPISFEGAECRISASIGTTVSSFYPTLEIDRMCSDADAALYQSKNHGRARSTIFQPAALAQPKQGLKAPEA
jgi:diguanylate cyclase (GGDEF)-like protein